MRTTRDTYEGAKILLVGAGGLGSAAALALARANVGLLGVADDDEVELTNLHRQVLYAEGDVGSAKVDAAEHAIHALAPERRIRVHRTRLLPANAVELVTAYDLVIEGSDNFATKFLAADACRIAGRPIVHGAAIRWYGTALLIGPKGRPCYRCLFEDLLRDHAPNCAEAGVAGPVVGVVGAIQADLALGYFTGAAESGTLVTFDGAPRGAGFRRRILAPRANCALCGAQPSIVDICASRYRVAQCNSDAEYASPTL